MGRGRGSPGSTSLGEGVRWEGGGAHQAVLHWGRGGEMGRGRGSPGSTSLGGG